MWRMMKESKEKELVKGGEGTRVKWRRWQEHGGGEGGESVTIGGEEYGSGTRLWMGGRMWRNWEKGLIEH